MFPISHDELDITDHQNVKTVLKQISPDIVINCAAYVRVDDCEEHPWLAFKVNALGPMYISHVCSQIRSKCIHISTDFVFDGTKGTAYNESDTPNPINTYGLSKLSGERLVHSRLPESIIVRISSLFSKNISRGKGSNFIETIIRKSESDEEIYVISDLYMSPTYSVDVSQAIYDIVQVNAPSGIYHLSNSGTCSWFELAEEVLKKVNAHTSIKPILASEYASKAIRPVDSSLASTNLSAIGLKPMRNWTTAVTDYLTSQGYITT